MFFKSKFDKRTTLIQLYSYSCKISSKILIQPSTWYANKWYLIMPSPFAYERSRYPEIAELLQIALSTLLLAWILCAYYWTPPKLYNWCSTPPGLVVQYASYWLAIFAIRTRLRNPRKTRCSRHMNSTLTNQMNRNSPTLLALAMLSFSSFSS